METLTDPDSLADNWKVLAETWEKRFWNEREDKDKIIKQRNKWAGAYFKAEKKYWNEHAVRTSSGKQLTTTEISLGISNKLNLEHEKQIRGIKIKLTVKNALYTLGGFLLGVIAE